MFGVYYPNPPSFLSWAEANGLSNFYQLVKQSFVSNSTARTAIHVVFQPIPVKFQKPAIRPCLARCPQEWSPRAQISQCIAYPMPMPQPISVLRWYSMSVQVGPWPWKLNLLHCSISWCSVRVIMYTVFLAVYYISCCKLRGPPWLFRVELL